MKKLLAAAPLAVLLVAACGGGNAPATSPPAPTTPAAAITCQPGQASGDVAVSVVNFSYQPADASASVGQTVAWTNDDAVPHTVTFDDGPDCGRLSSGEALAAEFNAPGEYDYHCAIHSTMRGTVSVSN